MQATTDTVVTLHYDLSAGGAQVESSRQGEPLTVLLGHGHLLKGLEVALEGHEPGDTLHVQLAPGDAYGERREGAIQRVPRKYFNDAKHLKPGMRTVLALREGGQRAVTVHKVGMTTIDVDTNHPMAGKTLTFDVEVVGVRAPTPAELEHGHAHPVGETQHA